jgi:ferredoxin-NADP reductase
MIWAPGTVASIKQESATARTLLLEVPQWVGHIAGQHVDVRLTAEDGYTAVRSYSIASAPNAGSFELTVEQIEDGEVSPYLGMQLAVGDRLEVRGPIGGWFVWRPAQTEPIQLIAGGSGIVPLMSMVRAAQTRVSDGLVAPMRLLYSVRSPQTAIYADELRRLDAAGSIQLTMVYTRDAPEGWTQGTGRIKDYQVIVSAWPPDTAPTCYVCGPSPFVETAASLLIGAGHDPSLIRTERFGPV